MLSSALGCSQLSNYKHATFQISVEAEDRCSGDDRRGQNVDNNVLNVSRYEKNLAFDVYKLRL